MNNIIFATSPYMQNASNEFMTNFLEIVGNPMIIGVLILLFITFLIVVSKLGFNVALPIYIPTIFICSLWIEPLRFIFAIVLGILISIGILRLIGKR